MYSHKKLNVNDSLYENTPKMISNVKINPVAVPLVELLGAIEGLRSICSFVAVKYNFGTSMLIIFRLSEMPGNLCVIYT